ncbi:hypothetical protein NC652_028846 [Populus alba x Populus x berolinensis]|uniref:Uncharacterized protein n=1 Tax=Populus alba x Populus x berolinensis TaxID=444605 RepID=A0AAD6LZY8_9ROSI|nr:hypothetical protein NC652_028785 [Populus alba x Populus x berolinensis]KAJ6887697.1 hypothetical protein NC652_028846 [Populus alba x Populus x berolinensis]KAJ6976436.1 hypothetical protein NC653_028537 [Populus alba x Populus x berolinensis]
MSSSSPKSREETRNQNNKTAKKQPVAAALCISYNSSSNAAATVRPLPCISCPSCAGRISSKPSSLHSTVPAPLGWLPIHEKYNSKVASRQQQDSILSH